MTDDKNAEIVANELRREYYRQWRKTHKEQVRKHNKDYWLRKAEKMQKGAADNDTISDHK